MEEITKLKNFINGEYVEPKAGKYLENINPSTGKVHSLIPDSQKEDMEYAIQCAKNAFPKWSQTSTKERANLIYKLADLIEKNLDRLALAESIDTGKPLVNAKLVDIPRSALNFRFYAGAVLHHENMSTEIDGEAINYSVSQPIGVCGLISPWNLPLYLLSWKIAPAIAVGNTCVCKPSEMTPTTAYLLGELCNEAGIPPGVVNIVFGYGATAGSALVSHKDVPLISFTGGTETGEKISMLAAPQHKKVSLELGGKNPNIIFADSNIEEAVNTSVASSFSNQGEICLCGSRILVEDSIFDEFVTKFIDASKKFIVGDPLSPTSRMGSLISLQHLQKVKGYIEIAKQEGGNVVFGGDSPKMDEPFTNGYWLNPTIITGLTPNCKAVQDEIFGPVVTILRFKNEEEAIEIANGVKYGLSASIWTENVKRANRVALKLQTGYVWVNCWMMRDLRVPFGGWKHSGVGREGGKFALEFYTEILYYFEA